MFNEIAEDSDRGQVGIGTLIVFIAMVLVAAIAAGVLINTAGFLQSSAEETGQQSSDQVTNRLEVVNTVGTDIGTGNAGISTVEITVRKAPGAGNIDLSQTIAQWVDSGGSYDFTYDTSPVFTLQTIQDEDDSITDSQVLNDPSDRAVISIDVDQIGSSLEEGDTATVKINTQSGGLTELRLVVPETLSSDSAVNL